MASSPENLSMALFCDFENVALGVRDTKFDKFDIKPVLERLLLKGSIVVKKAYCDWDRYKGFKSAMHEASFELIEIPHVRQSGKNSADIRLVVDALDLCYTKMHINTFVIISGDSDFSPLVSKLRENNKQVIGVGVKQSTSDLLIANCDEFIFYDDLVRESQHAADRRQTREANTAARRSSGEDKRRKDDLETRKTRAVEIAVETFDALMAERGDSGKIWASVLKEAIKRRRPDFNESYFGFRAFGNLLEEAQSRGLLEFGRDEKSGAYVFRTSGSAAASVPGSALEQNDNVPQTSTTGEQAAQDKPESRRRGRGGRSSSNRNADAVPATTQAAPVPPPAPATAQGWQPPAAWDEPLDDEAIAHAPAQVLAAVETQDDVQDAPAPKPSRSRASRAGRTTRKPPAAVADAIESTSKDTATPEVQAPPPALPDGAPDADAVTPASAPARTPGTRTASTDKPARKTPTRARRSSKTTASDGE